MRLYLSSFRNGNKPDKLLKLLGAGRRTAVIMNAVDADPESERRQKTIEEIGRLEEIGLKPEEVDLRKYFESDESLGDVLAGFDLVWARGGNSFLLRRAFQQSGADSILMNLLAEDAIMYGGYSAGCVVLSPNLRGIELVDPIDELAVGYNSSVIWEGMGIIPYAIAPHYCSDHFESDMIDGVIDYYISHHIPFIALQDGQAIVIHDSYQEVVG